MSILLLSEWNWSNHRSFSSNYSSLTAVKKCLHEWKFAPIYKGKVWPDLQEQGQVRISVKASPKSGNRFIWTGESRLVSARWRRRHSRVSNEGEGSRSSDMNVFWLLMETKWLLFIGDGTAEAKETEESLRFFRRSCLSFLQLSSCSPITPVGQWWPKGWRTELVTWRSQVQSIRIEEDLLLSYYLHRVQKVPSR